MVLGIALRCKQQDKSGLMAVSVYWTRLTNESAHRGESAQRSRNSCWPTSRLNGSRGLGKLTDGVEHRFGAGRRRGSDKGVQNAASSKKSTRKEIRFQPTVSQTSYGMSLDEPTLARTSILRSSKRSTMQSDKQHQSSDFWFECKEKQRTKHLITKATDSEWLRREHCEGHKCYGLLPFPWSGGVQYREVLNYYWICTARSMWFPIIRPRGSW